LKSPQRKQHPHQSGTGGQGQGEVITDSVAQIDDKEDLCQRQQEYNSAKIRSLVMKLLSRKRMKNLA